MILLSYFAFKSSVFYKGDNLFGLVCSKFATRHWLIFLLSSFFSFFSLSRPFLGCDRWIKCRFYRDGRKHCGKHGNKFKTDIS